MKKLIGAFAALALCLSLAAPAMAAVPAFADVPGSHWAYAYVQRAFSDGVIEGMSYNQNTGVRQFSGDTPMTVAQFTVVLSRAFYREEAAQREKTNWYNREYETLLAHGAYNGVGAMNFSAPVSRYEMAQIICNVMADNGAAMPTAAQQEQASAGIADWAAVPGQYRSAVASMWYLAILNGMRGGLFAGDTSLTRAQAAVVYCRMADAMAGAEQPEPSRPGEEDAAVQPAAAGQEVLRLVNQERAASGLSPLELDEGLCKAAQVRAAEIVENFAHTRPDGSRCFTVLSQAGISYRQAGENIAAGYADAASVMRGWMNSPSHRENIMEGAYTHLGVGVAASASGRLYWVQIFTC